MNKKLPDLAIAVLAIAAALILGLITARPQ